MKINKKYIKRGIPLTLLFIYVILLYNWNFTGSRWGKVVDAATGEPIKGAVVCMRWITAGSWPLGGGSEVASYETLTDKEGNYYVPNQRYSQFFLFSILTGVDPERVVIYKSGYCGYKAEHNIGNMFDTIGFKPYKRKGNVVKLDIFHGDYEDVSFWFYGHSWPNGLFENEMKSEKYGDYN
ncbi:MAG: carboxypeptidase regulatory-like domain-containing protein [Sedimentisphaerales bacterium]|nr:carboxypeptidase regulatory-like domain-containing protein [Sedimentisphaerales bacterium]MBN2843009.1 carboxypeptidase regulatory-like domain-containing protein [Sedimentisphaerales bacterium]